MTDDLPADVTRDAFLGGRVTVTQPRKGFRSGVDAVLLAACVPARPDDTVLELGCGVGVAALCLAARVPGVHVTGIEVQAAYAALARLNGLDAVTADLRALTPEVRARQFSHVMANPPYFDRSTGTTAPDAGRDTALGGDTPLRDWLEVGARRLAPGGSLTVIQHIARLPEVLGALPAVMGGTRLRPIVARTGSAPDLFLLQSWHSKRSAFRMLPHLVMHQGQAHDTDRESYTTDVSEILRNGAALSMAD